MTPPDQPSPPFLLVSDLALSRGGRLLFDAIAFGIGAGETLLVRGPNGAGKSSLLLTLAGILRPDGGSIVWNLGEEPQIHLFGHAAGVKTRLTLAENLAFWREVNGPTGIGAADALEIVGLGGLDGIEAGHLSAGQTRRLGLARLLVSQRSVWLLDEPTASLDAEGDRLVAHLIAEHAGAGGAAIVATHHDIALTPDSWTLTLGDTQ